MTIDQIRTQHSYMTDEQIEEELRFRDRSVMAIREEMAEIRRILDPRNIARQRALLANSASVTTLGIKPQIQLGGK